MEAGEVVQEDSEEVNIAKLDFPNLCKSIVQLPNDLLLKIVKLSSGLIWRGVRTYSWILPVHFTELAYHVINPLLASNAIKKVMYVQNNGAALFRNYDWPIRRVTLRKDRVSTA